MYYFPVVTPRHFGSSFWQDYFCPENPKWDQIHNLQSQVRQGVYIPPFTFKPCHIPGEGWPATQSQKATHTCMYNAVLLLWGHLNSLYICSLIKLNETMTNCDYICTSGLLIVSVLLFVLPQLEGPGSDYPLSLLHRLWSQDKSENFSLEIFKRL